MLKAKDKVERYRRNSLSSDVAQPPPYNPHYNQAVAGAHRRSNTCPEFMYPQPDRSLGWNGYQSVSENAANQSVSELHSSRLNDRYH